MKSIHWYAGLAAVLASAAIAKADVIDTLYGSGVGDDGILLAAGAVDKHWQLVGDKADIYGAPILRSDALRPDGWLPDQTNAGWINPCYPTLGELVPGEYVFRTTFDLTCFDIKSAELFVRFAADNQMCDVRLNGVALGLGWMGYDNLSPQGTIRNNQVVRMDGSLAAFDDLFVEGVNTFDFIVTNWGEPGFDSPTGALIELSGTADKICAVPEPGSVLLMAAAAGSAMAFRRFRRQPIAAV